MVRVEDERIGTGLKIPGAPEEGAGAERREARAARRTEDMSLSDHPDWLRLAEAIRRQIVACVEMDAEPETIANLAEQAELLATALESEAKGKRFGLVEAMWGEIGDAMDYLPFSPIMGRLNPASSGLRVRREGERAVGRVVLDETAEGAVGLSHGGVISGIWDEVLASANAVKQTGGPTGRLTIKYRKPTPLYEPLVYEAWVERIDERKVFVRGECRIEGQDVVLTEAEGIFIRLRVPGIDWHKTDQSEDAKPV
jgi:acyl-coenzyme A thioesterase PaaI-like protein